MSKRKRHKAIEYKVNAPSSNEWALLIGKLMLNYSALELELGRWVVHLSERAVTNAELNKELSRGFTQKHKEVGKLARTRSPSDEWLGRVLDRLKRAKIVADVRDQVAHSPILISWNDSRELGNPDVVIIPPTPRQRRAGGKANLEHQELKGAVDEAVIVVQDLHNLLEQWRRVYKAGNIQLDQSTLTKWQRVRRIGLYFWLRLRGW